MRTPYSEAFVFFIKSTVPGQAREWHKATKLWSVEQSYEKIMLKGMKEWFEVTRETPAPPPPPPKPITPDKDSAYHALICALPWDALKDVHKIAIRAVHPDLGGNTGLAQQVNLAWDLICKERGKR